MLDQEDSSNLSNPAPSRLAKRSSDGHVHTTVVLICMKCSKVLFKQK